MEPNVLVLLMLSFEYAILVKIPEGGLALVELTHVVTKEADFGVLLVYLDSEGVTDVLDK